MTEPRGCDLLRLQSYSLWRVVKERKPFKLSCSSTGLTTRKPTNSASVSHQMLCGRWGSRLIHDLLELRRAALRSSSGLSVQEPPRATCGKRSAFGIATGHRLGLSVGSLV